MGDGFGEMLDTSPEQRRRYYEFLRSLTVEQRGRKVTSLCQSMRTMAIAGIRTRQPDVGPAEIDRQLVELLYGPRLAARLFKRQ